MGTIQLAARCAEACYKSGLTLGILDVDHFKRVNDSYGHQAGDTVLAHLGSLVQASVRSTDVVARYGGDEFGLLFIEAGAKEANAITIRLLERISTHSARLAPAVEQDEAKALTVPLTVSVGVTHLVPEDNMETFIKRADRALFDAKAAGRNQVKIAI
jgi:diguanylate cyclase